MLQKPTNALEYAHLGVTEYSHIGMVFVAYTYYYYSRHSRAPWSVLFWSIFSLTQAMNCPPETVNTCGGVFAAVVVPFQLQGHLIGVLGFFIVVPFQLEGHLIGVLGFFWVDPFQLQGY
jgi:hypothetical protein